jgi:asparaginyl-tRNA synthetase
MMFDEIKKIFEEKKEGKRRIRGWLHGKRSSGGVAFFIVRDGTALIQATLKKEKIEDFEKIEKLPVESVIEIEGQAREDKRAPGGFELVADSVKVEHEAAEDFPIAKKFHGPDFLLDQRHFYIRSEKMMKILKVRAKVLELARKWFEKEGFTEFQSPIFVGGAVEGGSTLFPVKYFEQKAYLTQSWQLYAEAAIATLGKIYTVAPSFRAEKSRTRRHLTEYWHLEAEEPWCDLEGTLKTQEELITFILHGLAKEMPEEMKFFGRDVDYLLSVKPPFERITYDDAIKFVQSKKVKIKWGDDITWELEQVLTEKFAKPFFLTHFPKGVKAFYHMPDPEKPQVTLSADMLAPEKFGEIIGGGQRIDDYEELMKRIKEEKLDTKAYEWYLELRKYGTVPHSGFGLGIERLVAWVCKLEHIRDAIAFPRLINRVYP